MNGSGVRLARVETVLLVPYVDDREGWADLYQDAKRYKTLMTRFLEEHDVIGYLVEADPRERVHLDGEDWHVKVTFEA